MFRFYEISDPEQADEIRPDQSMTQRVSEKENNADNMYKSCGQIIIKTTIYCMNLSGSIEFE
jgi:hypothetical protein